MPRTIASNVEMASAAATGTQPTDLELAAAIRREIRANGGTRIADKPEDVGLGLVEHIDLPPSLAGHQGKVDELLKQVNRSPKVAGFLGKAAEKLSQVAGKIDAAMSRIRAVLHSNTPE